MSACLTDTFSKHFTHSLSFNECAVASVEMVSTRKETRSAHVALSKMDVQNEGGEERTAPKQWQYPQSYHEVNACPYLFLQTCVHVFRLFRLSALLVFVFLTPWWFTVFGEWARLSSVLVLYGTHRAHGKRMEFFFSAERAYRTDT